MYAVLVFNTGSLVAKVKRRNNRELEVHGCEALSRVLSKVNGGLKLRKFTSVSAGMTVMPKSPWSCSCHRRSCFDLRWQRARSHKNGYNAHEGASTRRRVRSKEFRSVLSSSTTKQAPFAICFHTGVFASRERVVGVCKKCIGAQPHTIGYFFLS